MPVQRAARARYKAALLQCKAPCDRQDGLAVSNLPHGAFDLIGLQNIGASGSEFRGAALRVLDGGLYALLRAAALQFGKIGGENL